MKMESVDSDRPLDISTVFTLKNKTLFCLELFLTLNKRAFYFEGDNCGLLWCSVITAGLLSLHRRQNVCSEQTWCGLLSAWCPVVCDSQLLERRERAVDGSSAEPSLLVRHVFKCRHTVSWSCEFFVAESMVWKINTQCIDDRTLVP